MGCIVRRMRLLVATFIIWLLFFYNIERLSEPNIITGVAYAFLTAVAVLVILSTRLRKVPLWLLLTVPILAFLMLKAWSGYRVWGAAVPRTVTEVCAIAVTIILARWVNNGMSEFESAIAHITIGKFDALSESSSTGQAEMYREMRRARHHQRPLSLVSVGVADESVQVALDRMVQEVQQAMMKRYVLSDVAKTLCEQLEDYDIIAQKDDHFLLLLPEVTSEQLADLTGQIRQVVSEHVGVTLQIGTASFPDDAVTFESLVEKAVTGMDGRRKREHTVRHQSLAKEHYAI
jgi:GGDEF domain-containing protein